jgi:hypothetical protein
MNVHETITAPDHVPDEWRQRYGTAHPREGARRSDDEELRARATVIRLLVWLAGVTVLAAALMWPILYVPLVLAVLAFVVLGAVAGLVFARWVLSGDVRP